MEKTNIIINLADSLVYNNRFDNRKLTAEQLSAESFAVWQTAIKTLHDAAYKVYVECENNDLSAEDDSIDKTEIYDAIRPMLAMIGDVKGYKLYANEKLAVNFVGYAGRRKTDYAPELAFLKGQLSRKNKEMKEYLAINVSDAEYKLQKLAEMQASIEELESQIATKSEEPDMKIKAPDKTNPATFRLEVEHRFARFISEQRAKTLEQLEAEQQARDADRKARAKARKANKKAEAEKNTSK